MNISIVLSTYNGEKYIRKQLDSLLRQTRQPEEVLILDDGSTDNTVHICTDFIKENNLEGWSITCNEKNIGWAENFHRGFEKASGDIIFPCDQDDIWIEDKIALMAGLIEKENINHCSSGKHDNERIGLLICGHIKQIESENSSRRENKSFSNTIRQLPFNKKLIFVDYPGCVYCFTKSFYNEIKGYYFEGYPHDAFLLRMGRLTQKAYYYDFPGIYWRRHLHNATGKPVRTNEEMRGRISYYIDCLESMKKWCIDREESENKRDLIEENIVFYKKRLLAFEKRKIIGRNSLFSCLKYIDFYPKYRSILGDLIRIIH